MVLYSRSSSLQEQQQQQQHVPDTESMAVGAAASMLRGYHHMRDAGAGGPEEEEEEEGRGGPCEEAMAEAAFNYCVVCEDGAYVRAGLELSSRHIYTIGSQSVVEVTERCINNQGLARLRTADGWISEMLNPLSGQVRGSCCYDVCVSHAALP